MTHGEGNNGTLNPCAGADVSRESMGEGAHRKCVDLANGWGGVGGGG